MLTHRNMVTAAASICEYLGLHEEDVVQGLSPMSFDYGLYQMMLSVRQGARLVLAPPFTLPAQVLKQAATERVTFFPGVPTQFALIGELKDVSRWDLTSVRARDEHGGGAAAWPHRHDRAHLPTCADVLDVRADGVQALHLPSRGGSRTQAGRASVSRSRGPSCGSSTSRIAALGPARWVSS